MNTKQLDNTKAEIRQKVKRDSALKLFYETYDALVDTLRDTYPCCKLLPDRTEKEDLVTLWHDEMASHYGEVKTQDKRLMLANVNVLIKLHIPQLWIDGKFSANSQRYIWMYLSNLCKFAAAVNAPNSDEPDSETQRDIRPPAHMPPGTLPGIQQIYDELPKNMLNKVREIAEKYSTEIDEGKGSVEDLKFDVISKELFSSIDPQEMHQMVTSVGNMLQGAMGGADGGEIGDLFQMFADTRNGGKQTE